MRTSLLALALVCVALHVAWAEPADPPVASEELTTDRDAALDPDTGYRWHLPRKRAWHLHHDALAPDDSDWKPLAASARAAKERLRKGRIVLDIDVALYDQYASETTSGQQNLGTFTWQAIGDLQLVQHDRLGTSYFHWNFLGSPGLNYDTGNRTLSGNVGSISGLNGNVYPDPAALDELLWKQVSPDGRFVLLAGRVDHAFDFDTNSVANDAYRQFFAFALENNLSIPWPAYGGLGAVVRVNLSPDLYVMAGAGDSGTDEPWAFWKSLDEGSWYQLVELGVTQSIPRLGTGQYRFIPWHNHLAGEDGWGIGLSADQELGLDRLVAFLRLGVGDNDVTPVERFVSSGLAFESPFGRSNDSVGVGVAWSDPSPGVGSRDETLLEFFYRVGLSPSIALTPDLQLVLDPANNAREDIIAIGGVRLHIRF
jgi:hypothetical protein